LHGLYFNSSKIKTIAALRHAVAKYFLLTGLLNA